jgi:hypothetical protein
MLFFISITVKRYIESHKNLFRHCLDILNGFFLLASLRPFLFFVLLGILNKFHESS